MAEIRQSIQGKKKHLCPKCKGTGNITIEYNGYPSGLPDSGWVYEPAYRKKEYGDLFFYEEDKMIELIWKYAAKYGRKNKKSKFFSKNT